MEGKYNHIYKMSGIINNIIIRFLFLLSMIFSLASAQWSSDPASPQMLGSGIQPQVQATSNGGVYIAWLTSSNYHVYIQLLNQEGNAQFSDGGFINSKLTPYEEISIIHFNYYWV